MAGNFDCLCCLKQHEKIVFVEAVVSAASEECVRLLALYCLDYLKGEEVAVDVGLDDELKVVFGQKSVALPPGSWTLELEYYWYCRDSCVDGFGV
jgi:hypothetical protein